MATSPAECRHRDAKGLYAREGVLLFVCREDHRPVYYVTDFAASQGVQVAG